jgi:hypothetical protein
MFAADRYRLKAAKCQESLNPLKEFDNQHPHMPLAGKEGLPPAGGEKIPSRRRIFRDNPALVAEEEENTLKCLGAAVILRWNTLPKKLQRELFEHADNIGNMYQTASFREPVVQVLHDRKDDEQETRHGEAPLENQLVGSLAFSPRKSAAEARHGMAAPDVLAELWRFSCEMPDAPHLNSN